LCSGEKKEGTACRVSKEAFAVGQERTDPIREIWEVCIPEGELQMKDIPDEFWGKESELSKVTFHFFR